MRLLSSLWRVFLDEFNGWDFMELRDPRFRLLLKVSTTVVYIILPSDGIISKLEKIIYITVQNNWGCYCVVQHFFSFSMQFLPRHFKAFGRCALKKHCINLGNFVKCSCDTLRLALCTFRNVAEHRDQPKEWDFMWRSCFCRKVGSKSWVENI